VEPNLEDEGLQALTKSGVYPGQRKPAALTKRFGSIQESSLGNVGLSENE